MPHTSDTLAADASRLLRYGLEPHRKPSHDPDYRAVCERYVADTHFTDLCAAVSEAMGLRILAVDPLYGVALAATRPSPFTFDGGDFFASSRTSVHERHRDGVILLGIVATAFPRRESLLEDPTHALPPFTTDDVLGTLRDALERAESISPAPIAPATDDERPLWQILRAMPETKETRDNRAGRNTRLSRVTSLLQRLRERGALNATSNHGRDAWRPTWHWQVQLRDFATGELWTAVAPAFWPPQT